MHYGNEGFDSAHPRRELERVVSQRGGENFYITNLKKFTTIGFEIQII